MLTTGAASEDKNIVFFSDLLIAFLMRCLAKLCAALCSQRPAATLYMQYYVFYIFYFKSYLFASIPLLTFPIPTSEHFSKFSVLTQEDPWITSAPAGKMAQVLLKLFQPC